MLRPLFFLFLFLVQGVCGNEHDEHRHANRWHTDWLMVVHHYNDSLKWLEEVPFKYHMKVTGPQPRP